MGRTINLGWVLVLTLLACLNLQSTIGLEVPEELDESIKDEIDFMVMIQPIIMELSQTEGRKKGIDWDLLEEGGKNYNNRQYGEAYKNIRAIKRAVSVSDEIAMRAYSPSWLFKIGG